MLEFLGKKISSHGDTGEYIWWQGEKLFSGVTNNTSAKYQSFSLSLSYIQAHRDTDTHVKYLSLTCSWKRRKSSQVDTHRGAAWYMNYDSGMQRVQWQCRGRESKRMEVASEAGTWEKIFREWGGKSVFTGQHDTTMSNSVWLPLKMHGRRNQRWGWQSRPGHALKRLSWGNWRNWRDLVWGKRAWGWDQTDIRSITNSANWGLSFRLLISTILPCIGLLWQSKSFSREKICSFQIQNSITPKALEFQSRTRPSGFTVSVSTICIKFLSLKYQIFWCPYI